MTFVNDVDEVETFDCRTALPPIDCAIVPDSETAAELTVPDSEAIAELIVPESVATVVDPACSAVTRAAVVRPSAARLFILAERESSSL